MAQQDPLVSAFAEAAAANPPQTDFGKELVSDINTSEQSLRIKQSSENYNLIGDLDKSLADEIGKEIKQGADTDNQSRSNWLDMHTFWMNLYMQQDYAQNASAARDWGATESIPILTEACNQFQSRTYKTFFPNPLFVEVIANQNPKDPLVKQLLDDRVKRLAHHMSYQLGVKDRCYKKNKDALFLGVAVHGSFFTKTYFDSIKTKAARVDNIRPTDLIVNYEVGNVDISDIRRKTHIIYSTVGETQTLARMGYFSDAARGGSNYSKNEYNAAVDDANGLTQPSNYRKRDNPVTLYEQHFYLDIDDTNNFLPYIGTIDYDTGKLLRLTIGYEATPDGRPLHDYEQIQYFTHYKFAENPDGFYGLGLGHLIGDLNSAVNIIYRQAIDAGTLANDGNSSGFISNRLALDEGDSFTFTLGEFKKVPSTVDDLNKSILTMKFPGPSEALVKLGEYLDSRAQRLGSTTEATTGAPNSSRQPTTYLAEVEQSLELFSSVQMRLSYSIGDELEKIYKINSKYLPLVDYYNVNGAQGSVTRADYQQDMLVTPVFDPKFTTRAQKVAKAQAELDATLKNPLSQARPEVYDTAFRRYLEALDTEHIDELLPPLPVEVMANVQQGFIQQQQAKAAGLQGAATQQSPDDAMAQGSITPLVELCG